MGRRLLESQNLDVVIANPEVPAMTFKMRFREVVVEKRVVSQLRVFDLESVEIQSPFQNGEGFLLSEDSDRDEVADVGAKILDLLAKGKFRPGDLLCVEPYGCAP